MEFHMLWRLLAILVAASSVASISEAQDIVLSGTSPPDASSHTFSQTCGAVHHYTLELSSKAERKNVLAHANDKVSAVTPPNLLAQIGGYDLYSVRMHCAESGGFFRIDVRKENGQFIEQDITIRDDSNASVGTAHLLKRMPKSN